MTRESGFAARLLTRSEEHTSELQSQSNLVCRLLLEKKTRFRMHPAVQRLIRGGKVVEYSAHLVPELGAGMMPRLSGDGVLVVGDAAGFLINNRYTFRGGDLAIASGVAAGAGAGAARGAGGARG